MSHRHCKHLEMSPRPSMSTILQDTAGTWSVKWPQPPLSRFPPRMQCRVPMTSRSLPHRGRNCRG
eukprot:1902442-Rhodomonas_salina.1